VGNKSIRDEIFFLVHGREEERFRAHNCRKPKNKGGTAPVPTKRHREPNQSGTDCGMGARDVPERSSTGANPADMTCIVGLGAFPQGNFIIPRQGAPHKIARHTRIGAKPRRAGHPRAHADKNISRIPRTSRKAPTIGPGPHANGEPIAARGF